MSLKKFLSFLTLFTSFSTLICCAIPALLVSLGLGASLVSAISIFPQLTWISEHKTVVFVLAGLMLIVAIVMSFKSNNTACPIDKEQAKACTTSKRFSKAILIISTLIYLIGMFFAFLINYF